MKALRELTRTRLILLLRQPEVVFWAFVFPILLSTVLGLAFKNRGAQPSPVGLVSGAAPALEARLESEAADHGLALRLAADADELERLLHTGAVDLALEPGGTTGKTVPELRFDAGRPESELARLRLERLFDPTPTRLTHLERDDAAPRFVDWFVPGLLALSIMSTSVWAVGFAFVEARQKHLLKRFLVTPMPRWAYLLSVVLARMAVLVFEVALLLLFTRFVLGVELRGSWGAFLAVATVGALCFAGLGTLLGSRSGTPEAAAGLINLAMMPMGLSGGVFFSYERFAEGLQGIVRLLPLTAFVDALRGVHMEGRPLTDFGSEFLVMGVWGLVAFLAGLAIFRWK